MSGSILPDQSRIILHADLDCFYCQVESVRLHLAPSIPLVVQQWQRVIAVNYAARTFGIKRHEVIGDCIKKCPQLRSVHVATYSVKTGQLVQYGAWSEDGVFDGTDGKDGKDTSKMTIQEYTPKPTLHKISLDAYRQASLKVLTVLKRFSKLVEKASVDEAFLEIGEDVVSDSAKADWTLIGNPAAECDHDYLTSPAKSDLLIYHGASIALSIRKSVHDELGYTLSVGIAHNKTLAKLASAKNKPDQQTFVLAGMVRRWMDTVPFSTMRFMGGKLGHSITATPINDEDIEVEDDLKSTIDEGASLPIMAADLLGLTIEDLSNKTGDLQSAAQIYALIRGHDPSSVNSRSFTKSFMSVKQFHPPLREFGALEEWIVVLCKELKERMMEEWMVNERWPRTLSVLYLRAKATAKSRSMEFPCVRPTTLSSESMVQLVGRILSEEIQKNHLVVPCARMAVSVSRFGHLSADPSKLTSSIDSFLIRGPSASEKDSSSDKKTIWEKLTGTKETPKRPKKQTSAAPAKAARPSNLEGFFVKDDGSRDPEQMYKCPVCSKHVPRYDQNAMTEHSDFHYALDLQRSLT